MTASILLAQILGLYLVIVGIALILNRKYYYSAMQTLSKNEAILLFANIFTLILGIILVVFHNIWVYSWPVIITLLAWAILLKGIIRLFLPKTAGKSIRLIQDKNVYYSLSAVIIILGIFLLYMGFSSSIKHLV